MLIFYESYYILIIFIANRFYLLIVLPSGGGFQDLQVKHIYIHIR